MTKWFDLLDLSYGKKLWDMLYIDPRGVSEGITLIFFKGVFEKHPNKHAVTTFVCELYYGPDCYLFTCFMSILFHVK